MKGLCKLEAGSASADIERKARLICKLSLWFGQPALLAQTADRQQRRLWFGKIVVLKLKKSVSVMHRNLSILKNIKNNEMNVITLLNRN